MNQKIEIRKSLTTVLQKIENQAQEYKTALKVLQQTNTRKANYSIRLISKWVDDGESSTLTEINGSLEEAILQAEQTFKKKNNRVDIQANYEVQIQLNNTGYKVPEKIWKNYTEQNRKKESEQILIIKIIS